MCRSVSARGPVTVMIVFSHGSRRQADGFLKLNIRLYEPGTGQGINKMKKTEESIFIRLKSSFIMY